MDRPEKSGEIKQSLSPEELKKIKQSLRYNTRKREWAEIIKIFKEHPVCYTTRITKSRDTALHVAVTHGTNGTLAQLLDAMVGRDRGATEKALEAKNEQGDTPLHCAAAMSSPSSPTMCKHIARISPLLVGDRNNEGETPLFLAALHGQKENSLVLHSVAEVWFSSTMAPLWRRKNGETILHCTIQREYFELARIIMHWYRDQHIASSADENGITPLHVLATKPSAFRRSTPLPWWSRILYPSMVVKPLEIPVVDYEEIPVESAPQNQSQDSHGVNMPEDPKDKKRTTWFNKAELPENCHTCHDFFKFLWALVRSVTSKDAIGRISETEGRDSTSYENSFFPLNYATTFEFFRFLYVQIFGLSEIGFIGIKKMKEKHEWCTQFMQELLEQNSYYEWTDGMDPYIDQSDEDDDDRSLLEFINTQKTNSSHTDLTKANGDWQDAQPKEIDERLEALLNKLLELKKEPVKEEGMTTLLTATKYGVIELVEGILKLIPNTIPDKTKEGKNILHVAVENRQPRIINVLKNHDDWATLIETTDVDGNNVLHLAAKVSKYKRWRIPGSALQMQWEIKWYQYVKKVVVPQAQHLIFQRNKDDKTPEEIFNESHQKLVEDGGQWLKSTSESCSVVAALIAGVSFATASQVPGGNDQSGKPNLIGQPAFNIFAIASLVSLCFSITALVMFLAILTSRQQPKDFRKDLPFKLLLGLSSLFVSISSILVSFCAAYFFVLREQSSNRLYIIYCVICLPVSFYAGAQFPLYLDLLESVFADMPQPSHKDDDS